MKATEAKLLDFLKKLPQFVIRTYQRSCSWTQSECQQLWDDILRTAPMRTTENRCQAFMSTTPVWTRLAE